MGAVVYRGPSMIDGAPILALLTGFDRPSENRKTGPIPSVAILRDDVSPPVAIRTGADVSICGDCPLRGALGRARGCYVDVGKGPLAAWRNPERIEADAKMLRALIRGRTVRIGSYGDPAAVPLSAWRPLLKGPVLAYTHRWRGLESRRWGWCMASCETRADADLAQSRGWRTFRIGADPIRGVEIICPNTSKGIQCSQCGLCDGRRAARNIAIPAHGNGKGFIDAQA